MISLWLAPLALADGPHAPSEARYLGPTEVLADTAACAACHPAAAAAWEGSAHAHASLDNPWYLASFDALRAAEGPTASRHCAGCHDPVLLAGDLLDDEVGPWMAEARVGVPCLGCHAIAASTADGNASAVVDLEDLPDPRADVEAHRARMRPDTLRDGTACQGCHRGVLVPEMGAPHVMTGFDDWGAWQGSAWAGTDAARLEPDPPRATCVDCHDHAMRGGRTALVDGSLLGDAVRLWLPVAWVDGARVPVRAGFAPPAGAEVVVDAVVRNVGAGHRFPGGLPDTQDVWLELSVNGRAHAGPHLRGLPLDRDGVPVRDHLPHRIAVAAFDHTIPPGEAQVLRVGFVAPGGPVDLDARLLHRPHRPELAAAACRATSAWTLDGCAPLPITVVAEAEPTSAEAWYAHALGLSRGLSEALEPGLRSLDDAVAAGLPRPTADLVRARILGAQGRVDEALDVLAALPDHPAVHATRGQALLAVWRWAPAAQSLARAVALAPRHVPSWQGLARARGSLGDDQGAWDAAVRGLALAPRDPDLLRSRALAAQALGHPDAGEALAAWLAHRPPEVATALRLQCDRMDPECAERAPIPRVWIAP